MTEVKPQAQALPNARGRQKLLNYRQVCEWLHISRSGFYRLASEGHFGEVYKIGASVRVAESNVKDYLEKSKIDPLV